MDPKRSYFTPRGRLLAGITRAHRALYRATGGLLGDTLPVPGEPGSGALLRAMKVLLLTTTGRRSGQRRTAPLPYFVYDGRRFVVASFAGGNAHPAWLHNALEHPRVTVQIGRERSEAMAAPLEGEERERYWARLISDWPRYLVYQRSTERVIPLVELRPL